MIARSARIGAVALVCLLSAGCPNSAGVTCPPGQTACGNVCVTMSADAQNCGGCGKICPAALACINGSCGCPAGLTNCNDHCVDTRVDGQNCGNCGQTCGPGTACVGGGCALTCGPNLTACGNQCIDTQNDSAHCGGCGMPCKQFTICCGGMCVGTFSQEHCGGCAPCPQGFFCTSDSGTPGQNTCIGG